LTPDFNYRLGSMSGSGVIRNFACLRRDSNAARSLHKTRHARFTLLLCSVAHLAHPQDAALQGEKLGRILHYVAV